MDTRRRKRLDTRVRAQASVLKVGYKEMEKVDTRRWRRLIQGDGEGWIQGLEHRRQSSQNRVYTLLGLARIVYTCRIRPYNW